MRLIDCQRCHVLSGGGKKKIEAKVVHTRDSVKLYFPLIGLKDARMKTEIRFFDNIMGILLGECELVIHRNRTETQGEFPWMADCYIEKLHIDENNRRGAVRIRTKIGVALTSQYHGTFFGTIADLSVGGMKLQTAQILAKDEEITFNYDFGEKLCRFTAKPIRGTVQGDGKYIYGCRFIDMSEGGETVLGKWLFKKQQELKKEIDGM